MRADRSKFPFKGRTPGDGRDEDRHLDRAAEQLAEVLGTEHRTMGDSQRPLARDAPATTGDNDSLEMRMPKPSAEDRPVLSLPANNSPSRNDRPSEGLKIGGWLQPDDEPAAPAPADVYDGAMERLLRFHAKKRDRIDFKCVITVVLWIAVGLACLIYLIVHLVPEPCAPSQGSSTGPPRFISLPPLVR